MRQLHLPAVLLGIVLLVLRRLLRHPTSKPVEAIPRLKIGQRVSLPLAISAARQHASSPGAPLLQLTPSEARRRIRPPPPAPLVYTALKWQYPDPPAALAVPRWLLTSPLMDHLVASPNKRFVFCPVPGAAAASLTDHLSSASGAPLQPLSTFAIRDRERLLSRPDVFRFVFVAHPFTRVLAAYYRGTRGPGGVDGDAYRQFMGRVRGQTLAKGEHEVALVSLQFFLTFLTHQQPQDLHEEFRSQTALCDIAHVKYTLVGRMDRLAAGVQQLDRRLGLKHTVVQADEHFREAERDGAIVFQNSRFRSKASKLYEDDLHHLAYTPETLR